MNDCLSNEYLSFTFNKLIIHIHPYTLIICIDVKTDEYNHLTYPPIIPLYNDHFTSPQLLSSCLPAQDGQKTLSIRTWRQTTGSMITLWKTCWVRMSRMGLTIEPNW